MHGTGKTYLTSLLLKILSSNNYKIMFISNTNNSLDTKLVKIINLVPELKQ